MKKLIAVLALLLVVCMSAALADGLDDAASYVKSIYKNRPASTPKDYELIGSVPGDGDEVYEVEWSADSDTIVFTRQESGMVLVDVDEDNSKEVAYVLTATVKDGENSKSLSFDRLVPASIKLDILSEAEIVEIAYALEDGDKLPGSTALTGKITDIPTPWSEEYKNITVNMEVAGKVIQCYRLTGEGAADLKEGDEIAVAGLIKNYKGTIEFDKGCVIIPAEAAQSARVALYAYQLEDGAAMSRESTLTGTIIAIPSAYSEEYKNITVNLGVPGLAEGQFIQCYRLTGEGAENLAEGDVITVTGTIKNYKGTIEFDKGCTFTK
ncbi:MAG: hypothetical protein J5564_05225 [Clostridia bacterium]|nr:hypothetical protein [Clostridia bacterium]